MASTIFNAQDSKLLYSSLKESNRKLSDALDAVGAQWSQIKMACDDPVDDPSARDIGFPNLDAWITFAATLDTFFADVYTEGRGTYRSELRAASGPKL